MGLIFNVHCFLVKVNVSKELFHKEISVVSFTLGSWEILGRLVRLKNTKTHFAQEMRLAICDTFQ